MKFEEHMRNWSGYENAPLYLDPATAKLVADVITAARDRVELDLEADLPCWSHLQGAIDALDTHHAKEKA